MTKRDGPDFGYYSHFVMLGAALVRTQSQYPHYPILECGSGFGSTPLIHYGARARDIVTVDTDGRWLSCFSEYASPHHSFVQITQVASGATGITDWLTAWEGWKGIEQQDHWGLAFVDCWPGEARVPLIKRLKGRAKVVIAHDCEADEPGGGGNYRWRDLDGLFAYTTTFKRIRPWTRLYTDELQCAVILEQCDR